MTIKSHTIRIIGILLFLLSLSPSYFGQNEPADTTGKSAKKAAILSAFLPGAGQVYNHEGIKGKRKLWKVPVIYAGLGTSLYFILENNKFYKSYREEYLWRLNTGSNPTGTFANPDYQNFSTDNLRTALDQRRSWRDLSVVCLAGVYVLQIVDASVDAHLFDHDISPDLSLNIQPQFGFNTTGYMGLKLTLLQRKNQSKKIRYE